MGMCECCPSGTHAADSIVQPQAATATATATALRCLACLAVAADGMAARGGGAMPKQPQKRPRRGTVVGRSAVAGIAADCPGRLAMPARWAATEWANGSRWGSLTCAVLARCMKGLTSPAPKRNWHPRARSQSAVC